MKSVSYFNIKLLCTLFILSSSHAYADLVPVPPAHQIPGYACLADAPKPTHSAVPGVCNVWTSDPELAKHVTHIEFLTKRTYDTVEKLQQAVARQKGKGRLNKILLAALLLETAYIASEQTESEITASLEKKWAALKDQYTMLYKSMTTKSQNTADKDDKPSTTETKPENKQ